MVIRFHCGLICTGGFVLFEDERRRKETNNKNDEKGMYQKKKNNEDQTRWLFSDPGKRVMKWRNMVVLYNLTGSRVLFPSAWNHTEPPAAQTRGRWWGGRGGSTTAVCVSISLAS